MREEGKFVYSLNIEDSDYDTDSDKDVGFTMKANAKKSHFIFLHL